MLDVYQVLTLPRLFPNLKSFTWSDNQDYQQILNHASAPSKDVYAPQFAQWIHLENLDISTYASHLPTMIIGSTIFNYLTKLDIEFHKEHIRDEEYTSFYIKPIAENIANLPALKELKVSYIKIDLDDMETLHNGALELEKISFGSIELVDTSSILNVARGSNLLLKAGGEPFVHKTASKLEDLSITLVADKTLDNSDRISNNLEKWIVYAGQKYPSIERLLIAPNNSTYNLYVGDRSLGDPLTKATSHMPNLKIYQMGFSNVTPNILRALNDNGVELDTIELSVTSEKDLINQIGSFKCSHQKQHVSTISILCVESYFTDDAFRLSVQAWTITILNW